MRKLPILSRPLPLSMLLAAACLAPGAAAQAGPAQAGAGVEQIQPNSQQELHSRAPNQDLFPGYSASPATERFPGYSSSRADTTPLSALPYVYALKRRDPAQMAARDAALLASLQPQLAKQAALLSFDLGRPGWTYQQIICPALPDYLLLSFQHGPNPEGSSRFTAVLEHEGPQVKVVSTYAHGMKPFTAAWSKRSTLDTFNRMLHQERGARTLAAAPNWLVIGLCYAELSGYPVQALTSEPEPDPTMDLHQLQASLPQMQVEPDRSAQVSFSDVSQPAVTTDWLLRFDKHGALVSVERNKERQPARARLAP